MRYLQISLLSLLFIACAFVKEEDKTSFDFSKYHKSVKNLEMVFSISSNIPSVPNGVKAKVVIAGNDSLQASVFAGFGLQVAKVFADSKSFTVFSIFENSVTKGSTTKEELEKLLKVSVEFPEFLKVIKAELPTDITNYKNIRSGNEDVVALTRNLGEISEYISLEKKTGAIRQIQIKKNGEPFSTMIYKDYKLIDGELFPSSIEIQIKEKAVSIKLDIEEIKLNPELPKNFRFPIPSDAKVKQLN